MSDTKPSLGTAYGEIRFSPASNLAVGSIIERIAKSAPGDVQEIAASQIALLANYYNAVLAQARQSFKWALVAAGIGLMFLIAAVGFLLARLSVEVAVVSTVAGAIVETISGLHFFLYTQATKQLASYHETLERTQRFLLANSICESLEGEERQRTRANLVSMIGGHGIREVSGNVCRIDSRIAANRIRKEILFDPTPDQIRAVLLALRIITLPRPRPSLRLIK